MRHHRCIELDWQEEKNMTEQDFLTKMKNDVLITENDIDMDMKLENLVEWDSLGFVNFILNYSTSKGSGLSIPCHN